MDQGLRTAMRILIVASFIPYPPDSGARIRTWEIALRMQRANEVVFAFHVRSQADMERAEAIRQQGFQVVTGWIDSGARAVLTMAREVLSGGVPLFALRRSRDLETQLARMQAERPFDVIQIEHFELARYGRLIGAPDATVLSIVLHDVLSVAYTRMAKVEPSLPWRFWREYNSRRLARHERSLLAGYDACVTVSAKDSREIHDFTPPHTVIRALPNCVDFLAKAFLAEPETGPPTLLFVGLFVHPPNADAARWMVNEIFPIVRDTHLDCRLFLVGADPLQKLSALAGRPGVTLVGRVDELSPYYRQCNLAVVPLRAGGGTRLKILEAMAFGRAVVSTTLGAEGLDARGGEHLQLADTAEDFARAVINLLQDHALRQRLRRNARALVEQRYSWDDCAHAYLTLYEELLLKKRGLAAQSV